MTSRTRLRPVRRDGRDYLTTAQVATLLAVKPQTVYAYVSRGVLHSTRVHGVRGSLFALAEVQALAGREGRPGGGGGVVERISTQITMIENDTLYYRGRSALELAGTSTYPEVAELLWDSPYIGDPWTAALRAADGRAADIAPALAGLPPGAGPSDRIRSVVGWLGAADPLRHHVSAARTTGRARTVLAAVVTALGGTGRGDSGDDNAGGRDDLLVRLWSALADRAPGDDELAVLNAALILLADHDLAVSAVAARVAASARASIYAVLGAGLGALDGPLHGGAGRMCVRFLARALDDPTGDPTAAAADQLASGMPLPGWGQVIYTESDPRADLLLELLAGLPEADPRPLAVIDACRSVQQDTDRPFPNIDLALAAMTVGLRLRPDTPETVFAVARMAGWTAHALEEYAAAPLRFRPVGVYVGVRPGR